MRPKTARPTASGRHFAVSDGDDAKPPADALPSATTGTTGATTEAEAGGGTLSFEVTKGQRITPKLMFQAGIRAIGPDRRRLVLASAMAFVVGCLETAMLFMLARLAIVLTLEQQSVEVGVGPIGPYLMSRADVLGALAGIILGLILVTRPLARTQAKLSSRVVTRFRMKLLRAYLRSDWAYRASLREGFLAQLTGEYSQRAEIAIGNLVAAVAGLITVSVLVLALLLANPLMSGVSLVGLVAVGVLLRPISARLKRSTMENAAVNRELVARVTQTARLGSEITAFDVGDRVADGLQAEIDGASRALLTVRYVSRLVPSMFQYLALATVVLLLAVLIATDSSAVDVVAPLVLVLVRALTYLRTVIVSVQGGTELMPYVTALEQATEQFEAHRGNDGDRTVDAVSEVVLTGVSYGYDPAHPVLVDVDLRIRTGEVIGVVGPSGAGKSTLSQLVLGLREPDTGQVLVGGVDLREISRSWWSRNAAYVPQDNQLIYGTVAENIAFFREGVTHDQIVTAARRAHVDDELQSLPEGYDTLIGPGARELSGGQRQRLGIARALVQMPTLLVMDEPTSALDARSEQLIRASLEDLRGTTAVVLVAHRPATLEICDRVIRVDEGRVREIEHGAVR